MLHVGGANELSFSLVPPPPPESPSTLPQRKMPDTNGDILVTKHDEMTSSDDVKLFTTTPGIVDQSAVGYSTTWHQVQQPPWISGEAQETYIVGPVMYLSFTSTNTLDAGFTIDLIFQHPSYLKASTTSYCSIQHLVVFTRTWLRYVRIYAVANPYVVCLSSVTFVHPTQQVEIFRIVPTPFRSQAICWRKRGSQI